MIRRTLIVVGMLAVLATPAAARADFGFAPGKTFATALNSKGSVERQAGAHPFSYTIHFDLNTAEGGVSEGGEMRDVIIDVPPGLVGNPQAVPTCPRQSFEGGEPKCKPSTQVGVLRAILGTGLGEALGPIYNLEPPPGAPVEFGFESGGLSSLQLASVRTEDGYGVTITAGNLPLEVVSVNATIWGTPADPLHTPERGPITGVSALPSEAQALPYLTLPTSCETPPQLTIRIDSKSNPGVFIPETVPAIEPGKAVNMTGCEGVPFSPAMLSNPSTTAAGSSSGLGFELQLKNEGLLNPKAGTVTETEPVKTVVTLPAGMTANPAAASGLGACSPAQYKAASLTDPGCPENAKLGTLVARTPLLAEPIEGSVYLASPHENPFGSLLALYIIARAPERGVLVKQAGEVQVDPATGQLTTTFDHLPPIPYSSFEVRLRPGARAPLITPRTCGTYTTTARFYPFSAPNAPVEKTAPFTITSSAGGGACAASEAQLPNHPGLEAGTTTPLAAAYAPFVTKVSRGDGEQLFSSVSATLPKGVSAKLAGVPYCSEAQIAAAAARSFEGGGALEAVLPSCPAASQVGTVNVGAGAGSLPYYVQGKVYFAGPYKGAPLSLAIITPAIAGPFDLGVVVVRAGLYVDESTAVVTVKSDPLPTMLQGIPLEVRSAAVRVDRNSYVLNPTNCEPMAATGTLTSTTGAVAPLSVPFQVGGCKGLAFGPRLALSLKGATRRTGHPAFKAVLTQPAGQANIGRTSVALPPTEFVDPNHVANPCTRPQFAANACPPASLLGKAKAYSPLLDKPLEGPVYFRANGGERELPDVVADLHGQVRFVLVGAVDALHKKGSEASRVRTTFATVPDAPVSKFVLELKGGKEHGLLVNSANICKTPNKAIVKMRGQNGKSHDFNPEIATSCKK